jgi:hypothetical protein
MKLQKLWDIEQAETGASLIGTKKRSQLVTSWRQKDAWGSGA